MLLCNLKMALLAQNISSTTESTNDKPYSSKRLIKCLSFWSWCIDEGRPFIIKWQVADESQIVITW